MLFTILIPTHDHADTLRYSINSVLSQSVQDFEIIVVGDGSPDHTGEIMREFTEKDSRINYIPHPKGQGHGEVYRHEALLDASGKYVCYLADDDLWLPHHLNKLFPLLEEFDFIHTLNVSIVPEKRIATYPETLDNPIIRKKMLSEKWNFFGPSSVAHTMSAYKQLPLGWNPRPDGMYSDLHMWRQWLNQSWCRLLTLPIATTLHFPSPLRKDWALKQRLEELDYWWDKLQDNNFNEWLNINILNFWRKNSIKPDIFYPAITSLIKNNLLDEANYLIKYASFLIQDSTQLAYFNKIVQQSIKKTDVPIE